MKWFAALLAGAAGSVAIGFLMLLIALDEDDDDVWGLPEQTSTFRCCDWHSENCEPPSELCCTACLETHHGPHRDVPGGPLLDSHHDGSLCALVAV